MKRIVTLTSFLIRDLFRSLAGIVPLACTLAFGLIAFEYGIDQPQFITVAGIGMGTICLATTLVLAAGPTGPPLSSLSSGCTGAVSYWRLWC